LQERQIKFEVDENLVAYLIEEGGFDVQLGARPMRHTIQRIVEGAIADHILAGMATSGDTLLVTAREGEIEVDVREERPPSMG
jgi:ATP-dependent Clp protease ATP-binding subunit ClpA